jgi:hypothetical protein
VRKILFLFCFFLSAACFPVWGSQLDLQSIALDEAGADELELLCAVRGLPTDGTEQELRDRLQAAMGINDSNTNSTAVSTNTGMQPASAAAGPADKEAEASGQASAATKGNYTLTILHADSMEKLGGNESLVFLSGNVQVSFSLANEKGERVLSAARMIVDLKHTRLSALGQVSFSDKDDSAVQEAIQQIGGSIVVLDWSNSNLTVSGGTVTTDRKNSNGDQVTFTATSSLLNYDRSSDSMIMKDGIITTDPETSYSSIHADTIAILPHGDMFLKDATIKIGRVPLLYFPYFFYPGATMTGHPSVGMESNRGLFVNTTYVLFGTYPSFADAEGTSFSSLLQSETDTSNAVPSGPIYKNRGNSSKDSDFDKWVKATSSYLALTFDAYQHTYDSNSDSNNGSAVLGYETQLALPDNAVTFFSRGFLGFAADGDTLAQSSYSYYPVARFDFSNELKVKTKWMKLDLTMPILSDPKVREAYANRLSSFSIDALWNYDLSFPTTYSSDITSYTWSLTGSLQVPTDMFGQYIQSLDITSLSSSLVWKWRKVDSVYGYHLYSMTLPKMTAGMKGELLNISFSPDAAKAGKATDGNGTSSEDGSKSPDNVDNATAQQTTSQTNAEDSTYSSIWGKPLSADESSASSAAVSSAGGIDLGYQLTDTYYDTTTDMIDSSDEESTRYDKAKGSLDLDAKFSNLLTVSSSIDGSNIYERNSYASSSSYDAENTFKLTTTNKIYIDPLGFTYGFNAKLYQSEYSYDSSDSTGNDNPSLDIESFAFSDDFVTKHYISLKHTWNAGELSFVPSIALQLPPLDWKLSPSLTLSYLDTSNTVSMDFARSSSSGELYPSAINDDLAFEMGRVSFTADAEYDLEYDSGYESLLDPLDLTSSLSIRLPWVGKLSQEVDFEGYDDGYHNCFPSIITSFDSSYYDISLSLSSYDGDVDLSYLDQKLSFDDLVIRQWKGRIQWKVGMSFRLYWDFADFTSSYMTFSLDTTYSIAKFLDLKISLDSSNYGFQAYEDDDGNFSFASLSADLLRSFDIIGGGNKNTQFNMEDISIEMVHYMDDWNLHCKYTGSVVLSDYTYQWVPTFSIYLQWKTIPELKVDNTLSYDNDEQQWTLDSD